MPIPADRSGFELLGEKLFTANVPGGDIVTPPNDEVDIRNALPGGFTHVEIIPTLSPVNLCWVLQPADVPANTIARETVFQGGAPGAVPADTAIQPASPAIRQLSVTPNPFGGAVGASPYACLVRVYRRRASP